MKSLHDGFTHVVYEKESGQDQYHRQIDISYLDAISIPGGSQLWVLVNY